MLTPYGQSHAYKAEQPPSSSIYTRVRDHTLETPADVRIIVQSIQSHPIMQRHISFSANPLGLLCPTGRQVPFAGFSIPADHGAK